MLPLTALLWLSSVLGLIVQSPIALPRGPRLHDNSSAPLVFNTLSALLLQWPNTYHPNGHSMVPGVIEPFTLLYHARNNVSLPPPSPEWFAFDPEMSYAIIANRDGHTYLHTYRAVRPIKIVYFDGMSAALSTTGWLDSQEVVITSRSKDRPDPHGDHPFNEYERARQLCTWGASFGIEGFVRMNTGFEVMWCDFHSPSIQLVSYLNITPPGTDPVHSHEPPPIPPGAPRRPGDSGSSFPGRWRPPTSPLATSARAEWLRATAHRSLTPQPHVKLDTSSFVSFYHPRLRSLVRAREGQRMRQQRVLPNISNADAESIVSELEEVLQRHEHGSRMDWVALARGIVEDWGGRVVQMRDFLRNATTALDEDTPVNMTQTLATVRRLAYSPLNPYMDTSSAFNVSSWDAFFDHSPISSVPQFANTSALHRCMFSATGILIHNPYIHTTSQEVLLQTSVETVLERLCSDFGAIFAQSMDADDVPDEEILTSLRQWETQIEALMEWLDWTEWFRCEEVCPRDSVCVMNMWPGMPRRGPNSPSDDDPTAWAPHCARLDSSSFGF